VTSPERLFKAVECVLRRVVPDAEFLMGDLREEYARGRSRAWLWMQVLAALLIGAWRETLVHRRAAASAALTGLASLWCLWGLSIWLLLRPAAFPHAVDWQWEHRLSLSVVGAAYAFSSGWIVGRMHQAHRTAAVCGFAASVIVVSAFELPLLLWLAPNVFFVTVVPQLPMLLVASMFAPIPIVLGGFWRPTRATPPQSAP
jgi:hypothetical protein